MAMMAIKGIYAEYGVQRLNHGIGFDTAAIELLLPTYARVARAEGQDLPALGAQPASGADPGDRGRLGRVGPFVRLRARHGGLRARAPRRVLHRRPTAACAATARSARRPATTPATCSSARRCRSTWPATARPPRSAASPASAARRTWAPTRAGAATRAPAWLKAGARGAPGRRDAACRAARSWSCRWSRPSASTCSRPSSRRSTPGQLAEQAGMALPPVMIYGDDVTHILTEEGIANLLLCRSDEEREQAIRGVAGYTPVGLARDRRMVENLRDRGVIRRAEDLGIDKRDGDAQPAGRALDAATWCAPRAACTSRRSAFATGEGTRSMETPAVSNSNGRRAAGAASRRCSSASSARATSRC